MTCALPPSRAVDAVQGALPLSKTDDRVKRSRSARKGERTTLDAAAAPQATAKGSQTPGRAALPRGERWGRGGEAPTNEANEQARASAGRASGSLPEISLDEINNLLIGHEVGRDTFINGRIRDRQLRDQSEDIVRRLECVGISARANRSNTVMIGLVSGEVDAATDYRNCNLIPVQQSRNVHQMLKDVSYLVETSKRNALRMLVVSGGWVPLKDYRAHHKAHTRRMSKFASHPALKEFGIEVLFYNVENTIKRDDRERAMLNMHSHVLFKSRRYLGKRKWQNFLTFAKDFFAKGYVHDSKVQAANEVVKYVFKPAEFETLTDLELGELFHQIAGGRLQVDEATGEVKTRVDADGKVVEVREGALKFFHPLGSFRAFRSRLRKEGRKLVKVPKPNGTWQWAETEKKPRQERPETGGSLADNRVLAITKPMPKFTRRMEPCLIVQAYDGDLARVLRLNGLENHAQSVRKLFANRVAADREAHEAESVAVSGGIHSKGGEAASMKHTTTTTVWETQPEMAGRWPPQPTSPSAERIQ